jgi:predicted nucleic acid-binding Zn ribbon protein
MPMLVSSAASPIGSRPAMTADATPTIQVIRVGTRRTGSVWANQRGSRPSRLIANHTRVTPSMNVNMTVRIPMMAPTATMSANQLSPTDANAPEKPLSASISV